MASTVFVDYSNATPITADWLNDVNRTQYTILGDPADRAGYIALDTAHAGGTSDAIIASFSVSLSTLVDGLTYYVRATAANTTATPTFTPNTGVITPAVIVRQGGGALYVGDIPFAGYLMRLQYDSTLTKWVLINPSSMGDRLQSVTATVGSNAITFTLNPTVLDFRSPTLTTGVPNTRATASAISVVISNGSTLGTVSTQLARITILAIDATSVGGSVELAVCNGLSLDESSLISTTAEGGIGGADTIGVAYSTAARTSVPFRIVGFIEIIQTGGTWAAPSLVQGAGGQEPSLGYGQSRGSVTRTSGATYYNTTGRPIELKVDMTGNVGVHATVGITINGASYGVLADANAPAGVTPFATGTVIIQPGESYTLTDTGVTSRTTYILG